MYKTPLQIELEKLNNSEKFEILKHESVDFLAIGIKINDKNIFFETPIDISDEKYNIVFEGEAKFKVKHFDNNIVKSITKLKNKTISVNFGLYNDEVYLSLNDLHYMICFKIDPLDGFMTLVLEKLNELPEDLSLIKSGCLNRVTSLYGLNETTIPLIDSDGNKYQEITTRTLSEIGLQICVDDNEILICKPSVDYLEKGIINIENNTDEIITFARKYNLKKSRDLNE